MNKVLTVFLFAATASWNMACSPISGGIEDSGSNELVSNLGNQAPLIHCQLSRTINNALTASTDQRVIASLSSNESPFAINPAVGETISVNCEGSQDETNANNLVYFLDTNYDTSNPAFVLQDSDKFDIPISRSGATPMALKIVDTEGIESVKVFSMVATCEDLAVATLDPNFISVTMADLNQVIYSIDPAAHPGQSNLLFQWDFNGDGVIDTPPDGGGQLWTDQNTLTVYTIFAGNRTPTVKAWNTCSVPSAPVAVNADLTQMQVEDRIQDSLAKPGADQYIQVDMTGYDDKTNADILVTEYPNIKCGLAPTDAGANFTLDAFYKYENHASHGIGFKASVTDDIVNSQVEGISSERSNLPASLGNNLGGANLSSAVYKTDGAGDGEAPRSYTKNGNCELHLTIKFNEGIPPCEAGKLPANPANFFGGIAYGEFHCDSLKLQGNSSLDISASNGKFYCEFNPSQRCIGGGGGGGGTSPQVQ